MAIDRSALLAALAEAKEPLGSSELLSRLGLHPGVRTELKRALRELAKGGSVVREGRRYRLALQAQPAADEDVVGAGAVKLAAPALLGSRSGASGRFVIGTLERHEHGFGFVRPLSGGRGDLYMAAEDASRAFDGDLVRVEVVSGRRGRPAARLVEVVERRRTRALGTLVARGGPPFVIPRDRTLGERIDVAPTRRAQDGDLVKVAIIRGPTRREPAFGEVVERIDAPSDPHNEVLEIGYSRGFSDSFPPDVLAAAAALPETPAASDLARRRDLRALPLVTIDGEDARDFDDAVYVEPVHQGFRAVVAIADVAHYVRAGGPLDQEALRRGTSVYFPDMVFPMLPERLSNGLCSLNPGEDRLCMVADLIFVREGDVLRPGDAQFYEAVMRSAARCTYAEVAALLEGKKVHKLERLRDGFRHMETLARLLMAMREERGAIDFELAETRVVLDERHRPLRLEKRERTIAHRIIEELMLAANEAVARYFSLRGLPTVYRVHGAPDEEKLEVFLALARAHGFALEPGQELSGKALNRLLKKMAGSPEQRTLNFLALRAMMQAIYSAENRGHFGLAAPFYLHFTSPIRRYPDLMVHRLLKQHWARGARVPSDEEREREEALLDGISARSSERERAAMEAERESTSYFSALYLKDKIGLEADGTVCAVADFGFFVELDEEHVEGLVKLESVGEGGVLDEALHRIVFPDGRVFGLGTKVRVRVASVNVARRHIDFEFLEEAEPMPARRKRARAAAAPAKPRKPAAKSQRKGHAPRGKRGR